MGKEIKFGLAAIGVLLVVFGVVLFMRLRAPAEPQPVAKASKKEASAKKIKSAEAATGSKSNPAGRATPSGEVKGTAASSASRGKAAGSKPATKLTVAAGPTTGMSGEPQGYMPNPAPDTNGDRYTDRYDRYDPNDHDGNVEEFAENPDSIADDGDPYAADVYADSSEAGEQDLGEQYTADNKHGDGSGFASDESQALDSAAKARYDPFARPQSGGPPSGRSAAPAAGAAKANPVRTQSAPARQAADEVSDFDTNEEPSPDAFVAVPNDDRAARAASGSRTYLVVEGDTLFDIARNELGKASRWIDVYELNRDQLGDDLNVLAPGSRLVLPDDMPPSDPITSRPQGPARR